MDFTPFVQKLGDFKTESEKQSYVDELYSILPDSYQHTKTLGWEPLHPNPRTSSAIQPQLYFGRAIFINTTESGLRRVLVMSGCTNKNETKKCCTEVQEWSLDDMTVRKLDPMDPPRTSFSCVREIGSRHIYVMGGNSMGALGTLDDVRRFDIFRKKWEKMPNMNHARANNAAFILKNYLYAVGGYSNSYSSSSVQCSLERLCLNKLRAWEILNIDQREGTLKACQYAYCSNTGDKTEILLFGGWYTGQTMKAIDQVTIDSDGSASLSPYKDSFSMRQTDLCTKPILLLCDRVFVV